MFNYREISEQIYKNYKEHEQNVKKLCVKSSIISLNNFYDGYQREIRDINSEITPCKDRPTNADFIEIFKVFDQYPANIQKPKKVLPKELNRLNSTLLKDSGVATSNSLKSTASTSMSNLSKDVISASEIYSEFKLFQQKFNKLLSEVQEKKVSEEYVEKLRQLSIFAKQLEKLLPTDNSALQAFTAQEENKLRFVSENMKELNFIQLNRSLYRSATAGTTMERLDALADILVYLLMSINCFNVI